MKKKIILATCLGLTISFTTYSQNSEPSDSTYANLSIEELMNVQVVSASKKSESAFEAPLSIGAVTKEEIQRAGVTSIPEALRLIPGVLVLEQTNGNYDVQIRGLNNLPPGTPLNNASNSITLVMINNRPVYNYFNGGTFWETLPVDLNDVERIEVVRGSSSPLYGPNAAAGVINIITRQIQKEGVFATGNVMKGTKSYIQNASFGFRKGKFDMIVSGNYQDRKRIESNYYDWSKNAKVSPDSVTNYLTGGPLTDLYGNPNAKDRYPDPKSALKKFGYNTFLNYTLSEKSNVSLAAGGQTSQAQKAFTDNLATPLSTMESMSNYVDLKAKLNNLNTMVAYQSGTQNVARGYDGYKYDFNTLDAMAEYTIQIKNFSVMPGLNYRKAQYDDSHYSDVSKSEGFINGKKDLINYAGSLRAEYRLKELFKLITALRVDKYNHPDKAYVSFQVAPSLKLSERHFVRAVYSRSYRGPNMYNSYNSQSILIGTSPLPTYAIIYGNPNLKLLSIDLLELGYRAKITDNFHLDVDLFQQVVNDFTYIVGQKTQVTATRINIPQTIENIDMKVNQKGLTIAANYVYNKLQIKPSITVQTTKLIDAPKYRVSSDANATKNIHTVYDSTHTGTPAVIAGLYMNYQLSEKWNINLSGYYFANYKYNNIYTLIGPGNGQNGFVNVPSKVLLNVKVGYKPIDQLELFMNARNIANQKSFEFAQTDKTTIMLFGGVNFNF